MEDPMATEATTETREQARKYQEKYYKEHRSQLAKAKADRWRNDPDYRRAAKRRARDRRALRRVKTADVRFDARCAAALERLPDKPRRPRLALVGKQKEWIYSSSYLARACGRTQASIIRWLDAGVLPGCSVQIGRRVWFTEGFINAVRAACSELLRLDGRGSRGILRRLIREQLAKNKAVVTPYVRPQQEEGSTTSDSSSTVDD